MTLIFLPCVVLSFWFSQGYSTFGFFSLWYLGQEKKTSGQEETEVWNKELWVDGGGRGHDFLDPVQLSDTDRKSLVERAETETQKAWTLVLLTGCDLDSNTNSSWFIALSSQGRRLP